MSLQMKYFVLKPAGDDKFAAASRAAMVRYSEWIAAHAETDEEKQFATQLMDWASMENAKAYAGSFRQPDGRAERG